MTHLVKSEWKWWWQARKSQCGFKWLWNTFVQISVTDKTVLQQYALEWQITQQTESANQHLVCGLLMTQKTGLNWKLKFSFDSDILTNCWHHSFCCHFSKWHQSSWTMTSKNRKVLLFHVKTVAFGSQKLLPVTNVSAF